VEPGARPDAHDAHPGGAGGGDAGAGVLEGDAVGGVDAQFGGALEEAIRAVARATSAEVTRACGRPRRAARNSGAPGIATTPSVSAVSSASIRALSAWFCSIGRPGSSSAMEA
jgi:hypothetical protein